MQKLYGQVIRDLESQPELSGIITDLNILNKNAEVIEELLSAVFPPTTANFMYGISLPLSIRMVYASPQFKKNLLNPETLDMSFPGSETQEKILHQFTQFAYELILKKFMGYHSTETARFIYQYKDNETGLNHYMEIRMDGRFIDVHPSGEMPHFPADLVDTQTHRMLSVEELTKKIPLDKFRFEGITVLRINDVTQQEVITQIKNQLLNENSISGDYLFEELEKSMHDLIGMKEIQIGITPFFKINNHYIYSEAHEANSILFRQVKSVSERDDLGDYFKVLFKESDSPLLFTSLNDDTLEKLQPLPYYYNEGIRSLIIYPLKQGKNLMGLLEIGASVPGRLNPLQITRIESAIPLFTLTLEKSLESLYNEVVKVIKRKFTAVQPAVEWKFTEAALNYIIQHRKKSDTAIERIVFHDVWPLYGAIDIRNSSSERSVCGQKDLSEQLQNVSQLFDRLKNHINLPLLHELDFKLNKFLTVIRQYMQTEDELMIHDFLKVQIHPLLKHLQSTEKNVRKDIQLYFKSTDAETGLFCRHRKQYEKSVSKINETLSRLMEKEQNAAQKVYPHYFERFITDGLEYNIYIGQSITPRKKFDEIYLHNLKMWQLCVMAKAARLSHHLESSLPHPLRTTQLILSYNTPISITFRTEEKKFDMDGPENARYEVVKKRIDKAHVKDTQERLTQPGKIAIVYSHSKEAEEYLEFIEYLQSNGFFKKEIEHLELENLQGVVGLKALRVQVNFDV
ncbi:MAG: hypothetical protein N2747_10335 [Chitinophagaceae bacterium]|nr:hypothetical protein [Chitinophagaceae bacterium]